MSTLLEKVREAFLDALGGEAAKGATALDLLYIAELTARRARAQAKDYLDPRTGGSFTDEITRAIFEVYSELFRAGAIAPGSYLDNRASRFSDFRITDAGLALLKDKQEAPENRRGYLAGIPSLPELPPVARSYLDEALAVFVAGHHRAAAVLLGAVVEVTVLELRDAFVAKLKEQGETPSSTLVNPKATAKDIYDVLSDALRQRDLPPELKEAYDAHWDSFLNDIRISRNATGHPKSLEPVTRDDVRAAFLQLRSVLKMSAGLRDWINGGFQN